MSTQTTLRLAAIAALLVLLAGCRSRPRGSGFLTDYEKLKPHSSYDNSWGWQSDTADLRDYDRLIIDPVKLRLHADSDARDLGDETLRRVTSAFRTILIETTEPYYSVVSRAEPGVVRIRIALTDVKPAPEPGDRPTGTVEVGEASMEAEMIDSVTGEVLAMAMSTIVGSEKGEKAPEQWRHVEGAFREWSQRLLDYLDENLGAD
jgi:hypothetical protein